MLATDAFPGAIFGLHLAEVARSHRALARTAQSLSERFHHEIEAARFERLAELAATDPQRARNEYRPARAFDPAAPIVYIDGAMMAIKRTAAEPAAYFNRGDVMTAYLLLLLLLMDCAPRTHVDAVRARETLVADYGLDGTEATRCVLAACLLMDHDIEP